MIKTSDIAIHTYLSNPGRLTLFLKRIGHYLTQNPISKGKDSSLIPIALFALGLFEEYLQYFEEFRNAIAIEGVDQNAGECVEFFRFLHALRRFVDAGITSGTIKTKMEKWSPEVNQKLNEELVQRFKERY